MWEWISRVIGLLLMLGVCTMLISQMLTDKRGNND